MFVYIRTCFRFALIGGNLTAQSTGSHRGIGGGIQIPETSVASSPFLSRPAVRALQRTFSQSRDLTATREAGLAKIREGYGMIGRIAMTEVFCEKERKCGISPRPTNIKVCLTTATLIFSLNTSRLFLPSYSLKDRKSRTKWATPKSFSACHSRHSAGYEYRSRGWVGGGGGRRLLVD